MKKKKQEGISDPFLVVIVPVAGKENYSSIRSVSN
jgi:hypothetical protein